MADDCSLNTEIHNIKQTMGKRLIAFIFILFQIALTGQVLPDSAILKSSAPERFKVLFETSKGSFTIEVIRAWSPLGADRFFRLVKTGFYNNNAIFRVQKEYVIQFGISDNKEVNEFWDKHPIHDEPIKASNVKGSVSFARDGAETRTAQLFINMKDNLKLDTVNYNGLRGFPPIGRVISNFETIESFNAEYGFEPANHQDSIMLKGNEYLKRMFPDLDYIHRAFIINE